MVETDWFLYVLLTKRKQKPAILQALTTQQNALNKMWPIVFLKCKIMHYFYFEYIKYVLLLIAYQRPDSCFKVKISSCLRRDLIIVRDFQGPKPGRDIDIARPRHPKTSLDTCLETRLKTSSSVERCTVELCGLFML